MKRAIVAFLAISSTVLAQVASAAEMKTILVFGDSLSDGFMLQRTEAYPALLAKKQHAAKNGAALVSYLLEGVAGDPSLNLPDGIHPNAAGQKILAENVWRVLEPIAREIATLAKG